MNELTNEQMQEQMQKAREYIINMLDKNFAEPVDYTTGIPILNGKSMTSGYGMNPISMGMPHKESRGAYLIVDEFHQDISERLQRIADNMSKPVYIVKSEDVEKLSENVSIPFDDILAMIEGMRQPTLSLKDVADKASAAFNELSSKVHTVIDHDDRPWYDKAANQGGKKRKQNYNNRQPWRK